MRDLFINEIRGRTYNFFRHNNGRIRKLRFIGALVGGYALVAGTGIGLLNRTHPEKLTVTISDCVNFDAMLRCSLNIIGENVDFRHRTPVPSGPTIKVLRLKNLKANTADFDVEIKAQSSPHSYQLANYTWYVGRFEE